MFKSVDYTAVHNYINGVKLDARASVAPHKPDLIKEIDTLKTCSVDISSMREDRTMAIARWHSTASSFFSARDQLVGVYEGVRDRKIEVGRDWKCNLRDFKVYCQEHVSYGDQKVALVPAVAGMATKEMSASSITAWTQFNVLLGTTGTAGPPDYSVMNQMMRVHNVNTNAVRFVHRLASLYLHLVWCERNMDKIYLTNKPNVENVNSTAAVSSLIARAQCGVQFIPWSSRGGLDDADVLEVLLAAGSGKLSSTTLPGSRFLKLWPFLGQDICMIVDDVALVRAMQNKRAADLTSRQVWFAAVRWITQYSDMKLWDEALQFVGTVCVSPSKGCVLTPSGAMQYGLPPSDMGAFCLGRFIEPIEEGSLATVLGEPTHAVLVEGHVVMATLLGLMMWYGAWKVCGWFYYYRKCSTSDAQEYWRRFALTRTGAPIWRNLQAQLELLLPGNVGRIFSTVTYAEKDAFLNLPNWHNRALQFEEIVARSKKVFEDSAIYGLLSPLRPTRETFNRGAWTTVSDIPAMSNINRAWYSMFTVAELALVTRGRTTLHSSRIVLPTSYRGMVCDYALFAGVDKSGNTFEPAFRISNKVSYYEIIDEKSRRYNYTWYVEEPDGVQLKLPGDQEYSDFPAGPILGGDWPPPSDPDSDGAESESDDDDGEASEKEDGEEGDDGKHSVGVSMDIKANYPALFNMLKRAEHWQDRGDLFPQAAAIDFMHRNGVRNMVTNALAGLISVGVSDDQARTEIDVVREFDVYDTLLKVKKSKRVSMCENVSRVLIHAAKNVTAGRVSKEIIQKYMAVNAAKASLFDNPSMTAEEYLASKSFTVLDKEGLTEIGKDGRKVLSTGRLPNSDSCRALIEGGYPLSSGIGKGVKVPVADVVTNVALDDIESMVRVLIESAWDSNVEPDMEYLREIAGPNFAVSELIQSMNEARQMDAQAKMTEESLNRSGTSGGEKWIPPSLRNLREDTAALVRLGKEIEEPVINAETGLNSEDVSKAVVENVISRTEEEPIQESSNVDAHVSSSGSSAGSIKNVMGATFVETIIGEDGTRH